MGRQKPTTKCSEVRGAAAPVPRMWGDFGAAFPPRLLSLHVTEGGSRNDGVGSPTKHRSGAGVGVGMWRGAGDSLT